MKVIYVSVGNAISNFTKFFYRQQHYWLYQFCWNFCSVLIQI